MIGALRSNCSGFLDYRRVACTWRKGRVVSPAEADGNNNSLEHATPRPTLQVRFLLIGACFKLYSGRYVVVQGNKASQSIRSVSL